jgi:hypothetical protein
VNAQLVRQDFKMMVANTHELIGEGEEVKAKRQAKEGG